MAEDNDKPEDEDENEIGNPAEDFVEGAAEDAAADEDDSDLFEPPFEAAPSEGEHSDDGDDPLGDALAEAAAGDIPAGGGNSDIEQGDAEEDDSELFEPPHAEEPPQEEYREPEAEIGGHQPVLPTMSDEDEDDAADESGDDDLFGATDEDQNDDDDEPSGGARQRYPWLQSSGEEEEEEPEESHSLQGRTLIFVGAAVVFVIFAALIWFLYAQGDDAPADEDVALVEAPEGPAKVVPDDRGGMEVPDQDKLVYDRVSGQETEMEEKLLDGPEEAIEAPDSAPETLDDLLESVRDEHSGGEIVSSRIAHDDPEYVAKYIDEAPAEIKVAEETAPVEAAPPPVASGGTHMVQLGAYGSAERAEIGWRTIKNRHSITLSGLIYDIQRADLGARGVVYRLRTEALVEADARDLCADLKAAGQDCLVVRR